MSLHMQAGSRTRFGNICILLFKWLKEEAKDKTAGCSLGGKIDVLQVCAAKRGRDELVRYFCSYSIQHFLLTKHYTCLKVWVRLLFSFYLALRQEDDTSIYLTWQWDRSCSFSSFFWFTWHRIRRTFYFFLWEGKQGREEKRRGSRRKS